MTISNEKLQNILSRYKIGTVLENIDITSFCCGQTLRKVSYIKYDEDLLLMKIVCNVCSGPRLSIESKNLDTIVSKLRRIYVINDRKLKL